MAHIGDPLEDLAWSLDPLWGWPERHLAGGLLPRQRAIDIWRAASGLKFDVEAFRWWQVFASIKGLAIWISSTEDFANGSTKEPILAMAGWVMTDRQNRILARSARARFRISLRGAARMIPRPQQALTDLAMKLAMSVAPETQSAYAASNAGMIAMLMQCLAQEFDRAAAVRTQDIDELTALFESLRDVPPDDLAQPHRRISARLRAEPAHRTSERPARAAAWSC